MELINPKTLVHNHSLCFYLYFDTKIVNLQKFHCLQPNGREFDPEMSAPNGQGKIGDAREAEGRNL